MKLKLRRRNEADRPAADRWRPVPCTDITPLRRLFDLQAGTIWADLRRLLPYVSGTLVDVGCGAQPYRRLLPTGAHYIGIDTAEAGSAFGYQMPDTQYYDGSVWPLVTASADVVLATETLEHVQDPKLFVTEAARVLKPAGTLILTVPFAARWHFIPHDYWRFTPSGLQTVLTQADFVDIQVYARGNELTVACYKLLALLLRVVMPQGHSRAFALMIQGTVGIVAFPIFLLVVLIAQASLRLGSGDDCIGYTAIANKKG